MFGPGEELHSDPPSDWKVKDFGTNLCIYYVGSPGEVSERLWLRGNWHFRESSAVNPRVNVKKQGGKPQRYSDRYSVYTYKSGAESVVECRAKHEPKLVGNEKVPDRFTLSLDVPYSLFDGREKGTAHKVLGKLMLAVAEGVADELPCAEPVRNG